jgi:hypothetical protein
MQSGAFRLQPTIQVGKATAIEGTGAFVFRPEFGDYTSRRRPRIAPSNLRGSQSGWAKLIIKIEKFFHFWQEYFFDAL